MMLLIKIISITGLALNIIPALLTFNDIISFDHYITLMLAGTLMWFLTAPFWINRNQRKGV
jgi:hypothetical protein